MTFPRSEPKWFVFIVKSKHEIKISELLTKMGIENYCPVIKEVRQWSDRKKTITRPLIPRYIFVYIPENGRDKVFVTKEVIKCLFWQGKPAVVPKSAIETLKSYLNKEAITHVQLSNIEKGQSVEIKSGAFKNQVGTVLDRNLKRVRIELTEINFVVDITTQDLL